MLQNLNFAMKKFPIHMLRKLLAFFFLVVLAASCKKDVTDYGPIDKKIIEDALNTITERHDSLRTSFELRAGQPVQVVRAQEGGLEAGVRGFLPGVF